MVGLMLLFKVNTGAVSKESKEVEFVVEENATYYSLGASLEEAGLIKSNFWYKVYIKLNSPNNLQIGTYKLNQNMTLEEIIKELEKGSTYDPYAVTITFKEGYNIRKVAKEIEKVTENSYDDVLNTLKDKDYINELINTYWFLENDILNTKIYYPLEGYLFPETYQISSKYSVKEVFKVMLDQTDKILTKYKDGITKSSYSIHELLTLASIIELEAGNADDRAGVAGVFYNRLNGGWTLGSDVTTYYALKIDDFSVSLNEGLGLFDCSTGYNTRCKSFAGLPVGPIDNPSEESIAAVVNPTSHNYYYFVADCKGKTYFNYDGNGHANTIYKLKSENNWCA